MEYWMAEKSGIDIGEDLFQPNTASAILPISAKASSINNDSPLAVDCSFGGSAWNPGYQGTRSAELTLESIHHSRIPDLSI